MGLIGNMAVLIVMSVCFADACVRSSALMSLLYSELYHFLSYTWSDMSVISVTLLHIRFIRNRSDLLTHKLTQFPSDLVKRIAVIIPEKSVIFLADILRSARLGKDRRWSRWWLGAVVRQASIWTGADLDICL